MNSGLYGTIRPAIIDVNNDVDIYYHYRPTRGTDSEDYSGFKQVTNPSSWLEQSTTESSVSLNGLYNLRLPMNVFNMTGIYTIYIKPKEIPVRITDVSVLEAYPEVKGVVFTVSDFNGLDDLTGYRIEYYDTNSDGTFSVNKVSRIITSCNRCEPVKVAVSDSYPKATRYRLSNNTANGLFFCTVTPSSSSSYRPNSIPFIGVPGGYVHVINTSFNPVMMEIEMVEHDAETISTMIEGSQIRDLDNGLITTYNKDKEIYAQHEYYTLKSESGVPLYDVKDKKTTIDTTQDYNNIVGE